MPFQLEWSKEYTSTEIEESIQMLYITVLLYLLYEESQVSFSLSVEGH
jgi:hypothetical protein